MCVVYACIGFQPISTHPRQGSFYLEPNGVQEDACWLCSKVSVVLRTFGDQVGSKLGQPPSVGKTAGAAGSSINARG